MEELPIFEYLARYCKAGNGSLKTVRWGGGEGTIPTVTVTDGGGYLS